MEVLSLSLVDLLKDSKNIGEFDEKLFDLVYSKFIEFTFFYETKQIELISATQDLVAYEKGKILKNIDKSNNAQPTTRSKK